MIFNTLSKYFLNYLNYLYLVILETNKKLIDIYISDRDCIFKVFTINA